MILYGTFTKGKKSSFTNWIAKFAFGYRLHQTSTVQRPIFRLFTVCSVLFKATFSDCHGKVGLLVTVYIGKLKPIWCMLMDFLSRLSLLVESRCRIGEARRSCSIVSFTTQPKANTATTTQRYKRLNKLFENYFLLFTLMRMLDKFNWNRVVA